MRSVHVGSHTKDQLAINQASNFGVCNATAIALFSPLCLPSGLEITFPKFPIMVIGDHDFLPIKQKSGRSDSKTIATTY